jgi:hypothetical protein
VFRAELGGGRARDVSVFAAGRREGAVA